MISFGINGATVEVWHVGPEYSPEGRGYRLRYAYRIASHGWHYVGNDIRSDVGATVDEAGMARTLFSFLSACAESRQYVTRNGGMGENADLFPEHVGQWAEENSDEISMLSIDPSEMEE